MAGDVLLSSPFNTGTQLSQISFFYLGKNSGEGKQFWHSGENIFIGISAPSTFPSSIRQCLSSDVVLFNHFLVLQIRCLFIAVYMLLSCQILILFYVDKIFQTPALSFLVCKMNRIIPVYYYYWDSVFKCVQCFKNIWKNIVKGPTWSWIAVHFSIQDWHTAREMFFSSVLACEEVRKQWWRVSKPGQH